MNKTLGCDVKKAKIKTFIVNGKKYNHYRHHRANTRQVELDKFNKSLKERKGRFISREETVIYKCGFNSGYKSGNKRGREVKEKLKKGAEDEK